MSAPSGGIIIDWRQSMPPDSPAMELEVVGSPSPSVTPCPAAAARADAEIEHGGGTAEFERVTDQYLRSSINRCEAMMKQVTLQWLPDGGKKIQARVLLMKKELERRRARQRKDDTVLRQAVQAKCTGGSRGEIYNFKSDDETMDSTASKYYPNSSCTTSTKTYTQVKGAAYKERSSLRHAKCAYPKNGGQISKESLSPQLKTCAHLPKSRTINQQENSTVEKHINDTFGSNRRGYPPGVFLNFMQQPHYPLQPQVQGENFHLVGQTMSFNPISQSPSSAYGTAAPEAVKQGTSTNEPVHIDGDEVGNNEANRAVKKRYWTPEEEERLASSWLNASKDPIKGNDKRGDTFWKEVTSDFNKKGNGKRTREMNQLKIHWSRLKASISDFNGFWTQATQLHTSGYFDNMHEEEAQKMYANKFGKRFSLVHWWKILKDEPKWCAQFQETEKNKSEIIDVPDEQSRPIGREAAKAERSGKRKKENIMEGIVILGDNIEKIIKVQEDRKVEREKVTEAQLQISNTNLKAAKEQKEAKMFEVYNSLLNQDISKMSEDQKANRDRAIRKIEEKLFAD